MRTYTNTREGRHVFSWRMPPGESGFMVNCFWGWLPCRVVLWCLCGGLCVVLCQCNLPRHARAHRAGWSVRVMGMGGTRRHCNHVGSVHVPLLGLDRVWKRPSVLSRDFSWSCTPRKINASALYSWYFGPRGLPLSFQSKIMQRA